MSFGIWQRTITDDAGNVLPGATIEVRTPSADFTGALVSLFSNEGGTTGLSNPFNADSEGFAQFYAAPRKVDIRATGSGSQRTWRNVEILGTAATQPTESWVNFQTVAVDTTMPIPSTYGIEVLEYTAATGTITLPDMSAQPGGGRFRILKNNATQGSVNINLSGTNVGIWGAVQLKLNADGDFWELQWTGSRFVLTDGFETGNNSNGDYWNLADRRSVLSRNETFNLVGGIINLFPFPYAALNIKTDFFLRQPTQSDARNGLANTYAGLSLDSTSWDIRTSGSWGEDISIALVAEGEWY